MQLVGPQWAAASDEGILNQCEMHCAHLRVVRSEVAERAIVHRHLRAAVLNVGIESALLHMVVENVQLPFQLSTFGRHFAERQQPANQRRSLLG